MKKFTVGKPMTLRDLAIKLYGSTQYLFKLGNENSLSIDTRLEAGAIINYDETFGDLRVKNKISNENLPVINQQIPLEGINYMGIEFDFIVK